MSTCEKFFIIFARSFSLMQANVVSSSFSINFEACLKALVPSEVILIICFLRFCLSSSRLRYPRVTRVEICLETVASVK